MEDIKENLHADLVIINGMVLTMDSSYRIIDKGGVAIVNGSILEVGEATDISARYNAEKLIDAGGKLVMPGLINAHTHAPMNIFRGFADDLPLDKWLYDHIFPLEEKFIKRETVATGTRLAIAEMIRSGTTTFNDMYYYACEMAQIAEQSGIRAILSGALMDNPKHNGNTAEEVLEYTEDLILKWKDHPRVNVGVAVHAPYSASTWLYRAGKELADKYGVQFHTHLSETPWEVDIILKKYGMRPVEHLEKQGVLGSNVVAAHGIHLNDNELKILAETNTGIAHNPQCNMKLANGTAPVTEMLASGIRVGIGTDGAASNNDLDLFDEIRSAALAHKLATGDPAAMDARTVLELATIKGARLLRADHITGSLEAGKQADVIIVDLGKPHAWPLYNIYSLIVYSLRGSDVESVIVDGQLLMENRRLLTMNLEDLFCEVKEISERITRAHQR